MADAVPPPSQRWFEDYHVGMVDEFGSVTVTAEEIVEFASRYDPQPMHTTAKELIASGWLTVGLMMRLFAAHYLSKVAALPSPGIDELRWPRPVRPGDTLRVRATVTEARLSRSKPDRGIVRSFVEVLNQHDEVVMSVRPVNLMRCRPDAPGQGVKAGGRA
jgi:acyl dehydratase